MSALGMRGSRRMRPNPSSRPLCASAQARSRESPVKSHQARAPRTSHQPSSAMLIDSRSCAPSRIATGGEIPGAGPKCHVVCGSPSRTRYSRRRKRWRIAAAASGASRRRRRLSGRCSVYSKTNVWLAIAKTHFAEVRQVADPRPLEGIPTAVREGRIPPPDELAGCPPVATRCRQPEAMSKEFTLFHNQSSGRIW